MPTSRLWPSWQHSNAPALRQQERVLVVAHGNSLRALVKHLNGISDADIADVEIPCGIPLIYELGPNLNRIGSHYLGASDVADEAVDTQLSGRT